jgi:hypothetical protein
MCAVLLRVTSGLRAARLPATGSALGSKPFAGAWTWDQAMAFRRLSPDGRRPRVLD